MICQYFLIQAIQYWSKNEEETDTLGQAVKLRKLPQSISFRFVATSTLAVHQCQVLRIAARVAMQIKDRAFAAEALTV